MAKWEVSLNCTRLDGKMCVVGPQASPAPPNTASYSPSVRRHLALRGSPSLLRPVGECKNVISDEKLCCAKVSLRQARGAINRTV